MERCEKLESLISKQTSKIKMNKQVICTNVRAFPVDEIFTIDGFSTKIVCFYWFCNFKR